jgi:hypothetical protein
MKKTALAVVVAAGLSLGIPAVATAETLDQAHVRCGSEATLHHESCYLTHLYQVNSTCQVGRGTITNTVYRTWGCPGSPNYVY